MPSGASSRAEGPGLRRRTRPDNRWQQCSTCASVTANARAAAGGMWITICIRKVGIH